MNKNLSFFNQKNSAQNNIEIKYLQLNQKVVGFFDSKT